MSQEALYRQHLETLDRALADALDRANAKGLGLEGAVFHAGRARAYYADDREAVFRPAAHFQRWVPLQGPEHTVIARPGQKPRVVRVSPSDFWYETAKPPVSYWENEVDLVEVSSFGELAEHVGSAERLAFVGESREAAAALGIAEDRVDPEALVKPLDWHRATKTAHEIALLERAAEKAAAGHVGAREVFDAGGTEREVHWAYLESSDQLEREVPYETIVAFDQKAATLHYQNKRGLEAGSGSLLLLDAGAAHDGYAADVTRTWLRSGLDDADEVFAALLEGVDRCQRDLVAKVTPGRDFLDLHVACHRHVAALLAATGVVKVGADEAFERGLTRAFLPHGLGHQLGLQVHDVGGHQASPEGGKNPPPEEYPMLRNTRKLEPGHVITIEPGIYFIPLLLDPLRQGPDAGAVDWDLVDRLAKFGGIRIEDNVACTEGEPNDFTRPYLEGPRGE